MKSLAIITALLWHCGRRSYSSWDDYILKFLNMFDFAWWWNFDSFNWDESHMHKNNYVHELIFKTNYGDCSPYLNLMIVVSGIISNKKVKINYFSIFLIIPYKINKIFIYFPWLCGPIVHEYKFLYILVYSALLILMSYYLLYRCLINNIPWTVEI